ncbi:hypothetical protein CHU98_g7266 [Xylaria longipes]|nr:hypothetical protein CHU98_g7266 [Xylaria longipes]
MVLPPPGDYHLVDFLHESELEKRTPINEAESTQLKGTAPTFDIEVYELLVAPERFQEHVTRYYGAVFLASVFGTRAKEFGDNTVIKRFFDIQDDWSDVMAPGFVPPYDIFPFLEYVPEFLTPWRGWREKVQAVGQNQHAMYRELVAGVREKMAQGIGRECFMQDLLNGQEKDVYSDTDIEYFGGMLLEGGSDTTRNVFETFLLAMVAHPSILKKAQEEVDGIFGSDKIPAGTHNAKLPYLTACLLEVRLSHYMTLCLWLTRSVGPSVGALVFPLESRMLQLKMISTRDSPFRPIRRLYWTSGGFITILTSLKIPRYTSIDEFHGDMLMGPKRSQARFRVRGERRRRLIEKRRIDPIGQTIRGRVGYGSVLSACVKRTLIPTSAVHNPHPYPYQHQHRSCSSSSSSSGNNLNWFNGNDITRNMAPSDISKYLQQTHDRLFDDNRAWAAEQKRKDPDFFSKLSAGQSPEYLWIGCSDSRIPAEQISGLGPGEAFIHRNIANLVVNTDLNVMSVIEYAVCHLHVKHIIVCGHYGCGGVKAAMTPKDMGLLNPWLRNIRDVYRIHEKELDSIKDEAARYNRLVELSVQEQCRNVIKTAAVQQSYAKNQYPVVHGWVFGFEDGLLKDLKINHKDMLESIQKIYNLTEG